MQSWLQPPFPLEHSFMSKTKKETSNFETGSCDSLPVDVRENRTEKFGVILQYSRSLTGERAGLIRGCSSFSMSYTSLLAFFIRLNSSLFS